MSRQSAPCGELWPGLKDIMESDGQQPVTPNPGAFTFSNMDVEPSTLPQPILYPEQLFQPNPIEIKPQTDTYTQKLIPVEPNPAVMTPKEVLAQLMLDNRFSYKKVNITMNGITQTMWIPSVTTAQVTQPPLNTTHQDLDDPGGQSNFSALGSEPIRTETGGPTCQTYSDVTEPLIQKFEYILRTNSKRGGSFEEGDQNKNAKKKSSHVGEGSESTIFTYSRKRKMHASEHTRETPDRKKRHHVDPSTSNFADRESDIFVSKALLAGSHVTTQPDVVPESEKQEDTTGMQPTLKIGHVFSLADDTNMKILLEDIWKDTHCDPQREIPMASESGSYGSATEESKQELNTKVIRKQLFSDDYQVDNRSDYSAHSAHTHPALNRGTLPSLTPAPDNASWNRTQSTADRSQRSPWNKDGMPKPVRLRIRHINEPAMHLAMNKLKLKLTKTTDAEMTGVNKMCTQSPDGLKRKEFGRGPEMEVKSQAIYEPTDTLQDHRNTGNPSTGATVPACPSSTPPGKYLLVCTKAGAFLVPRDRAIPLQGNLVPGALQEQIIQEAGQSHKELWNDAGSQGDWLGTEPNETSIPFEAGVGKGRLSVSIPTNSKLASKQDISSVSTGQNVQSTQMSKAPHYSSAIKPTQMSVPAWNHQIHATDDKRADHPLLRETLSRVPQNVEIPPKDEVAKQPGDPDVQETTEMRILRLKQRILEHQREIVKIKIKKKVLGSFRDVIDSA